MNDLTQGSIPRHLLTMALPIGIGMLVQTLYFLIDLYFVGRLGDAALAGVSAAGNAVFLVLALTQMLSVGAVALIAQAAGRKDRDDANRVFNQSIGLALVFGLAVLAAAYTLSGAYLDALGSDAASRAAGLAYLYAYAPGLAGQFALAVMGAALRGTGIAKPTMVVQMLGVLVNILLAPVLIAGWGTGLALGTAGAGLASTLAVLTGIIYLGRHFRREEKYVGFAPGALRPELAQWRRILGIGFPAGGEYACLFLYMGLIYAIISPFGAAAMAGFGVGARLMQSVFLPGMAIAFAATAVAGQNLGAGLHERVRATARLTLLAEAGLMAVLALLCKLRPEWLVQPFADDPAVQAFAAQFLAIISWNFVASGLIFACSSLFQALGNTWPALFSTATRLLSFAVPAFWLSRQEGFAMTQIWWLSVATVAVQALLSLYLLHANLRRRLGGLTPALA
ncbi:MAG: MATE family efflux transporter [Gammaproteobacteria bacterium]|nr:MATE family efflux transporter [Gammaproteobacteria bacterium]